MIYNEVKIAILRIVSVVKGYLMRCYASVANDRLTDVNCKSKAALTTCCVRHEEENL